MPNIEALAEEMELTCDYLEAEFILDGEFCIPDVYLYQTDEHLVVTTFPE
jgi:hypothetical protein